MATKKLKAAVTERYISRGGQQCPFCGEEQLIGDTVDIDGGTATQDIDCLACGESWTDVYELKAIEHGGLLYT